mmetsp:Transcript_88381/g.249004  ORF Transcript_88381/g.249004 Transcript_88381/m.249004 type:complete len:223 (+) Transcript_88381:309-977(+)
MAAATSAASVGAAAVFFGGTAAVGGDPTLDAVASMLAAVPLSPPRSLCALGATPAVSAATATAVAATAAATAASGVALPPRSMRHWRCRTSGIPRGIVATPAPRRICVCPGVGDLGSATALMATSAAPRSAAAVPRGFRCGHGVRSEGPRVPSAHGHPLFTAAAAATAAGLGLGLLLPVKNHGPAVGRRGGSHWRSLRRCDPLPSIERTFVVGICIGPTRAP